jgi:hypothetical protein
MTRWSIAETTTEADSQPATRRSDYLEYLASGSCVSPTLEKGPNLRRAPAEVEKVSTRSTFQVQIAMTFLAARAHVDPLKMMSRPFAGRLQRLGPYRKPLRSDIVSRTTSPWPWRRVSAPSCRLSGGIDRANSS